MKSLWLAILIAGFLVSGCGYTLSPNPYGLTEPLSLSIPVAKNMSRYEVLGPLLTENLINRLNSAADITVRENAPATLRMSIASVAVSGGAWDSKRNEDDIPTNSASRVINISVEAVFERPNPQGGEPLVRRQVFMGNRNFLVGSDQSQIEARQHEAFLWLIDDLGQKIAQTMFSEF